MMPSDAAGCPWAPDGPTGLDHLPADHLPADHLPPEHLPADHLPPDDLPADDVPADHLSAEALALLVQAMDQTGQGIVVCDSGGRVVLRNAPARDLGRSRDGDYLADKAIEAALTVALGGSAHEEVLDLYSPTRHTLEIRAFPLGGHPGGPPDGAVALVDDVSELRHLEAVRRDFVANLSHELKTPLGALSLLAETLDAEEDPEVVARLTARVGEEATRFSRIVDDLLDLSRIEAGGTGPLAPVAVPALVNEAVESFYDLVASRSTKLEVLPMEADLYVMGNRRDLVSAVANLVDNAIKYSEPGQSVTVGAGRDGAFARIRVIDEGVGIPSRDQERIFERFYRVDRARSRSTGGTGLGLAIVRHVVAYHGGEVSVQSVEGEGSTFLLRLPLAPPEGLMPEQVTVLLVEDEPSFVEALVVGLKREGFRVEVAYDGAEALEKFATVRPDLVLLDIMLPHVSGIDVCRTIRAGGSRTPIIMVTAKTSEIDTVVGLEVGADDYVSKPYRLRELVARIRAVLRRTPPAEEEGDDPDVLEAGDLRLDPERHEVFLRGREVNLPLKEFELLELLMSNVGRVITRETLIDHVSGPHYVGDTKTLDVHVKRLRARIEDDPARPQRITTIRGLGYKLEAARADEEGALQGQP